MASDRFLPFSLTIDHDDDDVRRIAQYLQNRNVLYRYSWVFIPVSVALIIFMVIKSMSYSTDSINYIGVAIISLVPAIILFTAILLSKGFIDPWFLDRRIKRLKATVPGFAESVSFNFTEEFIETATSLASSKLRWRYFSKVVELEDFFLFWSGSLLSLYIPKRHLRATETDEQIRELVRNKGLMD